MYNRILSPNEAQALGNGDMPGSGLGTYTLQDNLDINGTLTLNDGTLDVSVTNYQVNVGADWENFGGVFNARMGTVIFDGGSFQIPASETFYNFKKIMGSGPASTITFGRRLTVTIEGTMRVEGFDGSNLLFLESSSVGTQWNIDPQGLRIADFLNVRDSVNLTAPVIAPTNSMDGGQHRSLVRIWTDSWGCYYGGLIKQINFLKSPPLLFNIC